MFKNHKNIYLLSLILYSYILFIFCVDSVLNLFTFTLNFYNTNAINILFLVLAFVVLNKVYKKTAATSLFLMGSFLGIVLASFFISYFFQDISYDGQAYHIPAIEQLTNTWNPFYNVPVGYPNVAIFLKTFSKSGWYINAHFYACTGILNCAKASSFIFLFASFGIGYHLFSQFVKHKWWCLLLVFLFSFNPIWLNMYFSNLVDSQLGFALYFFVVFIIEYFINKKSYLVYLIFFSIIYIINIKFTAPIYLIVFAAGILVYILLAKKWVAYKGLVLYSIIAFLLGVFAFGYPTYVRNTIEHKHPFYPLYNEKGSGGGVFAMDYSKGNRVVNFGKSIFAKTNFGKATTESIEYKIPFSLSKYELERYGFAGVMVGGFGIWFSAIIIFCLLGFLHLFITYRKNKSIKWVYVLLFTLVISTILNPHAYIARYVPQFYLVFILYFVAAFYFMGKITIFQKIFACITVCNIVFMGGYLVHNINSTIKRKKEINAIAILNKPIEVFWGNHESNKLYFDEKGIKYIALDSTEALKPMDSLYQSELRFRKY